MALTKFDLFRQIETKDLSGSVQLGIGTNSITTTKSSFTSGELVPKSYVDAQTNGLSWKDAARAASTANIDLGVAADPSPVDGVTLANGDRILLKDQTDQTENGVYDAVDADDPTTWTRVTDMDEAGEFSAAAVFVQEGDTNADTGWVQTTEVTTLDATGAENVVWSQFTSATVFNTINGDSGSATPSGGAITVAGGEGIVTSATAATVTVSMDIDNLSTTTLDGLGDDEFVYYSAQQTDHRKITFADYATHLASATAGGLTASIGKLTVSLNEMTTAVVDVAADFFAFIDADDSNATRKDSIADLVSGIASTGLTASSGTLSVGFTREEFKDGDTGFSAGSDTITIQASTKPTSANLMVFLNGQLLNIEDSADYTYVQGTGVIDLSGGNGLLTSDQVSVVFFN